MSVYCIECGAPIRETAKFCASCGGSQLDPETWATGAASGGPAETPVAVPREGSADTAVAAVFASEAPPVQRPAAQPADYSAPAGASPTDSGGQGVRVVDLLRGSAQTPTFFHAAATAIITMLAAGLVAVAVLLIAPDASILQLYTKGVDYFAPPGDTSAFSQAAAQVLQVFRVPLSVDLYEGPQPTATLTSLFPVLPIVLATAAAALTSASAASRLEPLPVRSRMFAGLASGLALAVLLAILAAAAGSVPAPRPVTGIYGDPEVKFSILGAAWHGFVWGSIAGVAGVLINLRRSGRIGDLLEDERTKRWTSLGWAALVPLLWALLIAVVAATTIWIAQSYRSENLIRNDYVTGSDAGDYRSALVTAADGTAYSIDDGIGLLTLAGGAKFANEYVASQLPIPVARSGFATASRAELSSDTTVDAGETVGSFTAFGYNRATDIVFIPLIACMIGLAALAVHTGAGLSRRAQALGVRSGPAAGALVGPVWGVTMVGLNLLANSPVAGDARIASVALTFGFGGAALGTVGAAIGGRSPGESRLVQGPV